MAFVTDESLVMSLTQDRSVGVCVCVCIAMTHMEGVCPQ